VIAAVLEREPAPLEISPPFDRVVERCLAKDPDARFQTAVDLKAALKWAVEQTPLVKPATRRWMAAAVALGVCTAALAVALWAPWHKPSAEPGSYKFTFDPPQEGNYRSGFKLSPDGRQMILHGFDAHGQGFLMLRRLDSLEWRRVPSFEASPFETWSVPVGSWSPDSTQMAFTSGTKVKKLDVATGAVQALCDTIDGPPFTGWSRKGTIVYGGYGGLWGVSASGGTPVQLTAIDKNREEAWHGFDDFLPDGRHFLYLAVSRQRANSGIFLGSIDSPPAANRKFILSSYSGALYAPGPRGSGYVLFEREGALMGQPFDTAAFRLTGEPFLLIPKVGIAGNYPAVSVSESGVMAYSAEGASYMHAQLAWFTRTGERAGDAGPPGRYASFSISPDGKRLAVHRAEPDDSNVWVLDLARGAFTRLTLDSGTSPVWSPDGREIAYVSHSTIYHKPVDGTQAGQAFGGTVSRITDWSANGRILGAASGVLLTISDGKATPLLGKTDMIGVIGDLARFSPDGKWVAYSSVESKRQNEVYVQSFPPTGAKYQISTNGGAQPHWRADGRELFYIAQDGKLMAVPVKTGATFEYGSPLALFQMPVPQTPGSSGYAVSPDGQRFLLRTIPAGSKPPSITIVTNWLASVKH
jgi:Tol biopolymer transport system component